jgi:N-acetylated-alpha-linked acidic dipeptidase
VSGSHMLEEFAAEVADSVQQPGANPTGANGTNPTLAEYALHHPPGEPSDEPAPAKKETKFVIGALGAGSDYQGFLDYLGIASMNEDFSGQTKSGIYHSVYDSIYWYTHFSDTTEADGRALSQYSATALLRLADAAVLPFEFGRFTATVTGYADEIQKEAESGGHKLDFSGLRKQLEALKDKGQNYDALLEVALNKTALDPGRLQQLNSDLLQSERVLTRPEGLPNRPWYKHQIYAPGFYTGYAVKTLPGIREAVEMKNWKLAQQQMANVEQCLSDLNGVVAGATEQLAGL